uniref:Major facilitator superfamily (MFS) profile domain-containing protein n=1 Tax=Neogobius melanostomus TaxID=47308 RepID=A0A8C6SV47_9GOBI
MTKTYIEIFNTILSLIAHVLSIWGAYLCSPESLLFQFSLVCDDQWKQTLSSQVYFLGGLCGCIVCGQLSDRFGRKPVLFGALLLQSVFSSVTVFAPSWPVFTFFFFVVGLGQTTAYLTAFVLGKKFKWLD